MAFTGIPNLDFLYVFLHDSYSLNLILDFPFAAESFEGLGYFVGVFAFDDLFCVARADKFITKSD